MKKSRYILILIISLIFCGCSNMKQPKNNEKYSINKIEENKSNSEILSFPDEYKENFGKIKFNTKIVIKNKEKMQSVVKSTAKLQSIKKEKVIEKFSNGEKLIAVNEIDSKNERDENVKYSIYKSSDELNLSIGPLSSQLNFYSKKLYPYITRAFRFQIRDDKYNLDKYSSQSEFPFKSKKEAFRDIKDTLGEIGIEIGDDYKAYSLDYNTMKNEEYEVDKNGDEDKGKYKSSWGEEDNVYYFFIGQNFEKLPVYHVYYDVFKDSIDENAPIQVVYSKDGIEYMDIEKVFDFKKLDLDNTIKVLPFNEIAKTVVNKYKNILGESYYNITEAELKYMVDTSYGKGTYDVKPVWIVNIEENIENERLGGYIQMIVDAVTAEEIV